MNRRDALKAAVAAIATGLTTSKTAFPNERGYIFRGHVEYNPIVSVTGEQTGIRWHGWVLDPTNAAEKQAAKDLMHEQNRPGWKTTRMSYTFRRDRIEFDILLEKVFS